MTPVPLVPAGRRGPVLVVAASSAALLAVLGLRYRDGSEPGRVDSWFDGPLSMRGSELRWLPEAVVSLGSPLPAACGALLLGVAALALGSGRALALVAIAPPLAVGLTQLLLKPLVGRVDEDGLVFPSGHATSSSALLLTGALMLASRPDPGPVGTVLRATALVGGGLLLLAVPPALAATGYHYVTDGVGAILLSVAVVGSVAPAVDRVAERGSRVRAPVPRRAVPPGGAS